MRNKVVGIVVCIVLLGLMQLVIAQRDEMWFEYRTIEELKAERFDSGDGWAKLDIPDIRWDRFAPIDEVGWCGEASLQMALMYNGVYLSQWRINELGSARNLDLYAGEIVPTMDRLGLEYIGYENTENQTVEDYINWVEGQIQMGRPVFSGVKVYPGGNPEWILDHFVLMVGYEDDQLIYNANTPGDGQMTERYELLATREDGYRLENDYNEYFGYAIAGLERETREIIPKVHILKECESYLTFGITIEGLEKGSTYQLHAVPANKAFDGIEENSTEVLADFVAEEESIKLLHENVERQAGYYYRVLEIQ